MWRRRPMPRMHSYTRPPANRRGIAAEDPSAIPRRAGHCVQFHGPTASGGYKAAASIPPLARSSTPASLHWKSHAEPVRNAGKKTVRNTPNCKRVPHRYGRKRLLLRIGYRLELVSGSVLLRPHPPPIDKAACPSRPPVTCLTRRCPKNLFFATP